MYQFTGRAYDREGDGEDGDIINEIEINVTAENEGEALEKIEAVVNRVYYEFLKAREIKIVD